MVKKSKQNEYYTLEHRREGPKPKRAKKAAPTPKPIPPPTTPRVTKKPYNGSHITIVVLIVALLVSGIVNFNLFIEKGDTQDFLVTQAQTVSKLNAENRNLNYSLLAASSQKPVEKIVEVPKVVEKIVEVEKIVKVQDTSKIAGLQKTVERLTKELRCRDDFRYRIEHCSLRDRHRHK